jgi:hypothetical protein
LRRFSSSAISLSRLSCGCCSVNLLASRNAQLISCTARSFNGQSWAWKSQSFSRIEAACSLLRVVVGGSFGSIQGAGGLGITVLSGPAQRPDEAKIATMQTVWIPCCRANILQKSPKLYEKNLMTLWFQ